MEDFPPNSDRSKRQPPSSPGPQEKKDIKRVTSEEPKRRKKPLGTRFKETFIAEDMHGIKDFVIFEILIPQLKYALSDAISGGVRRMLNVEAPRPRYQPNAPQSGPTGYVSYNRYSMSNRDPEPPRQLSRRGRSTHDFDEIILSSRVEADEVIDRLYDLVSKYDSASVADLYELTGVMSNHQDQRWGWTDLRGAGVLRVRNGYLLNLPEAQPLG